MDSCENPVPMGRVVCPKPRRARSSNANNPSIMPLRFHICNDAESKPGAELLGLILRKMSACPNGDCELNLMEDFKAERCATPSSSPPFFFGSPPCRTSNPLIQDSHFGGVDLTSICKSPKNAVSPQSAARAREQFGKKKQAAVRVEGFDCQNSHAVASA